MFQFRTLCNVAQTSAKWGQTLFEIVWRQKEKIKYEPANFEIFKTVTNFSPKTASVAQNQNLLVRQPFCKFKSETAFRLEIQFKVKSNIAKLALATVLRLTYLASWVVSLISIITASWNVWREWFLAWNQGTTARVIIKISKKMIPHIKPKVFFIRKKHFFFFWNSK